MLDIISENLTTITIIITTASAVIVYILIKRISSSSPAKSPSLPSPAKSLSLPSPAKPLPPTSNGSVLVDVPKKAAPKIKQGIPLKIYFGSQTGTAEDFAKTIATESKKYGFAADVIDLDGLTLEKVKEEKMVIFVVATYGDGEPTDNAKEFYDALIAETESDALSGVTYMVFGLGNKTYQNFNMVSRSLDKKLAEIGAERLLDRGEGDDDSCLEDDFNKWKKKIWAPLCKKFDLKVPTGNGAAEERIVKQCIFTFVDPANASSISLRKSAASISTSYAPGYDPKNPIWLRMMVNRELHTPESDRSCRHIEFDVAGMKYEAGDHLGIYPENKTDLVNSIAEILGITADLDKTFIMEIPGASASNIGPCTIRYALTNLVDISGPVRKSLLKGISQYTSDAAQRTRLEELVAEDSEGESPEFNAYVRDGQRDIIEILREFSSCRPPLDHFLELMPRMQPRYYSISSSQKKHPDRVHITSVVVDFVTSTGRKHLGVCSSYLASLSVPDTTDIESYPRCRAFFRRSTFHLPENISTPIIMIGPGTGLAPFRGFIQDREADGVREEQSKALLYFGCRDPKMDYLYGDELEAWKERKNNHLSLAFSRAQERKVYVTHRLKEDAELIWATILSDGSNGCIYVCGDGKSMAKTVVGILTEIISEKKSISTEQAQIVLNDLVDKGRVFYDVW